MGKLEVVARDGTETLVLDSAFRVHAAGTGTFSKELPPGLYKLRFRAGQTTSFAYAEVPPDAGTVSFPAPILHFGSAAPLDATSFSHEYHQAAAKAASQATNVSVGSGSQIFVFARAWAKPANASSRNPAEGLELRDLDGQRLVDLEAAAKWDVAVPDPWAGCTIDVDPGSYRLTAHGTAWGSLEQLIVASENWQTQVFLLQKFSDPDTTSSVGSPEDGDLDLVGSTILYARPGVPFSGDADVARQVELTRIALENGRTALPADLREELLYGKFSNPMLGILGAHALLRESSLNAQVLQTVVGNLRDLVGTHPDVEALALALPDEGSSRPLHIFESPPMLASSWSLVVNASAHVPSLVPPGSLSARISPHLWGAGSWLVWLGDELAESEDERSLDEILDLLTAAPDETIRALRENDDDPLTDGEDALLAWLPQVTSGHRSGSQGHPSASPQTGESYSYVLGGPPPEDGAPIDAELSPVTGLSRALQLPPAAVQSLASSVVTKMTVGVSSRSTASSW